MVEALGDSQMPVEVEGQVICHEIDGNSLHYARTAPPDVSDMGVEVIDGATSAAASAYERPLPELPQEAFL